MNCKEKNDKLDLIKVKTVDLYIELLRQQSSCHKLGEDRIFFTVDLVKHLQVTYTYSEFHKMQW